MKDNIYIMIWTTTQVLLFFAPIIAAIFITALDMDYNKHILNTVNERALNSYHGDITYEKRVWLANNEYLIYIQNLGVAIVFSLYFQILNMIWYQHWLEKY